MNVRNGIENLSQILPSPTAPTVVPGKSGNISTQNDSQADTAQVSAVAAQVAQSAGASDVRLDRVASIQAALQAGNYQVPASAVAQKVIGALLVPKQS